MVDWESVLTFGIARRTKYGMQRSCGAVPKRVVGGDANCVSFLGFFISILRLQKE